MTKGEWKSRKLGDFFRIKHGYPFKSKFFSTAGDLIVLTPGNFHAAGGIKLKGDKEKYYIGTFPPVYLLTRGDMLVVMTDLTQNAPILGSPAFVPEGDRYLHNQRLGKVVDVSTEIDRRFLFYLFNSSAVRDRLKATATGATVKHTAPERIYSVDVWVPSLSTQRKIASILSAYDDMIENNLRRIQILEEMAQALYREWFVEFRFPGHETTTLVESKVGRVPAGWGTARIQDLTDVCSGFAFKSKTFVNSARYKVITIKNVKDGVFIEESESQIDAPPLNMPKHCYLRTGDILLSLTGNVGRCCLAFGADLLLNQRVAKLAPYTAGNRGFIYFMFRQGEMRQKLEMLSTGVAQQNLSPIQMGKMEVVLPPENILSAFAGFAEPICEGVVSLNLRDRNLRSTRDLLLPKLISGELDVSDLKIDVGEAA